ncbi:MAG: phosphoenolpyruvate carboxylase [Cyclobacteriaceae bacterium]|nr:phosphoenolpyruvate carboxylase [Cyclobacteriaceae bacterium]
MNKRYEQVVGSKYHIYNSLFLNLPFRNISHTGTLLPLLQDYCEKGFDSGKSADLIIPEFFSSFAPEATQQEQFDLLFKFIQYVERQVALFDSVEDASFEQINDLTGKGTITSLLLRAQFEGKEEELKKKLETFGLRVVLTAHPTQFYPGFVLGILNDLEQAIRANNIPQIDLLLQQLGKTAFINKIKPTPYDEAISLCWYLENIFYHAIPQIISLLTETLQIEVKNWRNNRLIMIGFWPGGDRDGNPHVTSSTTLKVAHRLKETVMKNYHRDVRLLRRRLTFQGVDSLIIEIERKIYNMAYARKEGYAHPDEILQDLFQVRDLLISEHDGLFIQLLDTFILKVRLFGFHFASLDIRQDSRKHDAAWKVLINQLHEQKKFISFSDYEKLSDEEKIAKLLGLTVNLVFVTINDEFTEEVVKTIQAIEEVQKQNGEPACHRYVISNCQSALHVMEVYTLCKLLIGKDGLLPLDIVPLFETIDDLANAPGIMKTLYEIKEYREHLKRRGNQQTIMLGFSDGTKDGGYLRANWSIFRAKENLTAISSEYGIAPIFFDGRGGPPARGGGNTHDFYASLGKSIASEQVQITIQGQTISSNFGKVNSCRFNLEQLLSAGLEGAVFEGKENHLSEDDKKLLDELAEEGYQSYLGLKHHPKFVPYLEKITPLSFFGDTNIGSRPVKRSSSEGLKFEDLRAIPFVGSWAMMKQNIPGFYGVGSSLLSMQEKGKEKDIKDLYKNSLFFRTLLGNSMMSLTKSYYPATAYLAEDKEFGDFWKMMYKEFELSTKMVLEASSATELMEANPNIKSSVRLRERIVLPLIAIQQYSLIHLRESGLDKTTEDAYRKLVIRCMFGIINAARNSA